MNKNKNKNKNMNDKKIYKRICALVTAVVAVIGTSACGAADERASVAGTDDMLRIVTTIFPEYDWVMNILGEDLAEAAEVTLLLDDGVDLHNYQPTADDMLKIAGCDLFIYVGGESDKWVDGALEAAANDGIVTVDLLSELGEAAKEEEVKEGMQADDETEVLEGSVENDTHKEMEFDEHVWLSLRNSEILCGVIADAMAKVDPAHMSEYKENAGAYISQLDSLDREYEEALSGSENKTLLFGDRFPFRYLTDDYGLDYYAAFAGCSAETEASFETVTFLAAKVDELSLHSVLTIDNSDRRIAKTIIENTQTKDQQIYSLDSMQAVTSKDVQNGASYINIMKSNLKTLIDALK